MRQAGKGRLKEQAAEGSAFPHHHQAILPLFLENSQEEGPAAIQDVLFG
jgi:hypothetical protein